MSGQDEALVLDFAGEIHRIPRDQAFTIGREGDLALDDNPFLHRRFLVLQWQTGLWWVVNVGSRLGTTVAEAEGSSRSWVAPGARVPLVFPRMALVFTAGATTYEILLEVPGPLYEVNTPEPGPSQGETTVGQVSLTPSQHLLILSLAEPWLRRTGTGPVDLPRNADAAARLGWSMTRFNRKLDNVCDKLDRLGVKGMRGGPRSHASYRRNALVEYALAARLVTVRDLPLLDHVADGPTPPTSSTSPTAPPGPRTAPAGPRPAAPTRPQSTGETA
ncbi:FHA domain-containing protein [uncultured Actinomyces sp.]|uniref:FHA domain-containing protein n=1 Tax=uncultured Actinomyces sp. TaxID=249061 RepID=UPI0028DB01D8|nr:FHA domain-containing protein [uncultured Actinomyces sp.]